THARCRLGTEFKVPGRLQDTRARLGTDPVPIVEDPAHGPGRYAGTLGQVVDGRALAVRERRWGHQQEEAGNAGKLRDGARVGTRQMRGKRHAATVTSKGEKLPRAMKLFLLQ